MVIFAFLVVSASAQEVEVKTTSATDHQVRIHKGRRINLEAGATERHGKSLKKRKAPGGTGSAKDAKVYKRHRHFADREIKYRAKSRGARKEALGVGTE
jgi:hypothetical protein